MSRQHLIHYPLRSFPIISGLDISAIDRYDGLVKSHFIRHPRVGWDP